MRVKFIAIGAAVFLAAGSVDAAEKAEVLSKIEGARAAVENFAAKAKNNGTVIADIEAARSYLRKAAQAFEEGKQMFGLGGLKPAAEQEISHSIGMAELNIALAESRLAKEKTSEELAAINAQLDKVKAKVKVFDDKKAVIEKLRVDAAKYEAAAKELATLKTDKALLISQVEMLMAERKQFEKLKEEKGELIRQLDELKGANTKPAEQLEKQGQRPVPKPATAAAPEAAAVPAPAIPAKASVRDASPADRPALEELVVPEREKAPKEKPDAVPAPVAKPVSAPAPEAAAVPAPAIPAKAPEQNAANADPPALEELVVPERENPPLRAGEPPAAAPVPPEGDGKR